MHSRIRILEGCEVSGTDGELGFARDILLCEHLQHVRFIVVETTTGIPGRRLLVPTRLAHKVDDESPHIRLTTNMNITLRCVPVSLNAVSQTETRSDWDDLTDEPEYWLPTNSKFKTTDPLFSGIDLLGFDALYPDGTAGRIADLAVDTNLWQITQLVLLAPHLMRRNSQVLVGPEYIDIVDRKHRRICARLSPSDAVSAPQVNRDNLPGNNLNLGRRPSRVGRPESRFTVP